MNGSINYHIMGWMRFLQIGLDKNFNCLIIFYYLFVESHVMIFEEE